MCYRQLICNIFVGRVIRVPVSKMVFDRKCIWLLRSVFTTVLYKKPNTLQSIIIYDTLITLPRAATNLQIS